MMITTLSLDRKQSEQTAPAPRLICDDFLFETRTPASSAWFPSDPTLGMIRIFAGSGVCGQDAGWHFDHEAIGTSRQACEHLAHR